MKTNYVLSPKEELVDINENTVDTEINDLVEELCSITDLGALETRLDQMSDEEIELFIAYFDENFTSSEQITLSEQGITLLQSLTA